MMIILKANKVNLFVSSVLFVFWYQSPNFLDTPHICNISSLRVKGLNKDGPGKYRASNVNEIKDYAKKNGKCYFMRAVKTLQRVVQVRKNRPATW
jgi:hypothetical protein